jgi:ribosome-associated toxin RatA of RatAB toxin-antitoxin module
LQNSQLFDRRRRLASLAISVLCACTFISSASAKPGHGVKPVVSEELVHGKTFYVNKIVVNARPERVYQILTDYMNATKVFPILKKCEILQNHGQKKIVKHRLAPTGLPTSYEYVIEVSETAPHILEWHRVSGDFKELDGYWKLEPTEFGHSTMVTYATHVVGGFFMPQILIKRQFSIDMPIVLDALKNASEISTEIAARHIDPYVQN